MKTAYIFFIYLVIINYSPLCAMEIIDLPPQKKDIVNPIIFHPIQDIPHLSFEKIKQYCTHIPSIKEKLLSQSLTFNIALLPKDITCKIISYMFYAYNKYELDNHSNNELIEKFYITPPLCAQKKYIERQKIVHDLLRDNQKVANLYDSDELIPVFFKLPDDQYQEITKLISPVLVPSIETLILIIDQSEENKIKKYPLTIQNILRLQNSFSIRKINNNASLNNKQKKSKHTIGNKKNPKATIIGALAGFGCGAVLTIIWGTNGISRDIINIYIASSILITSFTTLTGAFAGIGIDQASNYFTKRDTVNVDI